MKKSNFQIWMPAIILLALSTALLSFISRVNTATAPFGGEGFEIYINNKLVLQQYGKEMNTVKTISLQEARAGDQLAIRYYHCGKAAKNRVVTIRDDQQKLLKQWKFEDSKNETSRMSCSVKEIMALPKLNPDRSLLLYYSSSELPAGRHLATIKPAYSDKALP